jgi:hypothetical protein
LNSDPRILFPQEKTFLASSSGTYSFTFIYFFTIPLRFKKEREPFSFPSLMLVEKGFYNKEIVKWKVHVTEISIKGVEQKL